MRGKQELGTAEQDLGVGWLILVDIFIDTFPVRKDCGCLGIRSSEETFTRSRTDWILRDFPSS